MVSDAGRVKAISVSHRIHGTIISKPCNIGIIPHDNSKGYQYVSLSKNGIKHNRYVHRLVAEAFIKNVSGGSIVNHLDYNKSNNRSDNLEWCSQKENIEYSRHHMRHPKNSKLPSSGEKYIHLKDGSFRVCIKQYGIDKSFRTLEEAIQTRNEVIAKYEESKEYCC